MSPSSRFLMRMSVFISSGELSTTEIHIHLDPYQQNVSGWRNDREDPEPNTAWNKVRPARLIVLTVDSRFVSHNYNRVGCHGP